ncbi:hypothetical protein U1Q18_003878 [Sarracenia purpurea var. burkii]
MVKLAHSDMLHPNHRSYRHVEADVIDSNWLKCCAMAITKGTGKANDIEESMKRASLISISIKPFRGTKILLQFPTEEDKAKTLQHARVWLDK